MAPRLGGMTAHARCNPEFVWGPLTNKPLTTRNWLRDIDRATPYERRKIGRAKNVRQQLRRRQQLGQRQQASHTTDDVRGATWKCPADRLIPSAGRSPGRCDAKTPGIDQPSTGTADRSCEIVLPIVKGDCQIEGNCHIEADAGATSQRCTRMPPGFSVLHLRLAAGYMAVSFLISSRPK